MRGAAKRGTVVLAAVALPAVLAACLTGCPRTGGGVATGGEQEPDTWVVFDVVERGSGTPLLAYVWVEGHHEDFETVIGDDSDARFMGFGKTGDGYAVPFARNAPVRFIAWSPDHEVTLVDATLKRGENLVTIELRPTEIEDEKVPEEIRLDVLNRLPTEKPKTGS